jgi:hypothetical protein
MISQILKVVLLGFLGGIALFAIPFIIFKVFFFFLFIGILFRIMGIRRYRRRMYHYGYHNRFYQGGFPQKETLKDHLNQNPKNI